MKTFRELAESVTISYKGGSKKPYKNKLLEIANNALVQSDNVSVIWKGEYIVKFDNSNHGPLSIVFNNNLNRAVIFSDDSGIQYEVEEILKTIKSIKNITFSTEEI